MPPPTRWKRLSLIRESIFFQPDVEAGAEVFYAFAHTSRRPNYWKSRI